MKLDLPVESVVLESESRGTSRSLMVSLLTSPLEYLSSEDTTVSKADSRAGVLTSERGFALLMWSLAAS